ncbi:PTS system glucoside-specific EIICBA component [Clostridium sp. C105KSO15]|nr:PTS system glucoside-specific EIICBA component [Clostridium sp. C105KSO15]
MVFEKLKREKTIKVRAPITGSTIDVETVLDEVFSKKLLGDGIAIQTTGSEVAAPADGNLVFVTETRHAFGIQLKNNMQILVHVGLETTKLQGEGFELLATPGEDIITGTPILRLDRELIEAKGYSLVTVVIIVAGGGHRIVDRYVGKEVIGGITDILVCK